MVFRWTLLLLLSALTAAQTASSAPEGFADPGTYQAFFRQIANLKDSADHPERRVTLHDKSKSYRIVVPKVGEIIGLSDRETDLLTSAAKACMSDIGHFSNTAPVVFEARMQQIENGQVSATVASQVDELKQRYTDMIMERVRQLKSDFGAVRFQILDDYIRAAKWKRELVSTIEHDGGPQ